MQLHRMEMENAQRLLKQMLGPDAEFRSGQWDAINLAANQRKRVLVVQRTGWGKSVVYFMAAKILRETGGGVVLLISPLLSLMRNQLLAAQNLGIRAMTLNSQNLSEWPEVEQGLNEDQIDVLMISPERLASSDFSERILPGLNGRLGMFVVDEAHCISDWGHDFRPDYRRIVRIVRSLPAKTPVLCTTATANDRVVKDIESQIEHLHILRGPLVRRSLKLFNIQLPDQAARFAWLACFLPQMPGSGIIYTLTIQDARRVSAWLVSRGINARPYHADLPGDARIECEQQLLNNEVKALVATVALGMGFDKPDLGFVVHFQRPGSVVAYYQQVGRAGRAVSSAYGVLLSGREDDEIQDYFIRTAFPPAEVMEETLRLLGESGGLTIEGLCAQLNLPYGTLEKALHLLEVDEAVRHEQRKYFITRKPWRAELMRAGQVTQHRRAELAQMKSYVEHPGCLMEFLSRALDDPAAGPCGKCMNCTGQTERKPLPGEIVHAAVEFLRADTLEIEPRKFWPGPLLPQLQRVLPDVLDATKDGRAKVTIPERLRCLDGRVLCIYGDAGWGEEVSRGKYHDGEFSDELVGASASLIREKWQPQPAPRWMTIVPSQRHAKLVWSFAERLARQLELPLHSVLRRKASAAPQKTMQNSVMQLDNLLETFELEGEIPAEPVLLIDDVVDSRWTITLAGVLLQRHGSGPVHPFALARASVRGS